MATNEEDQSSATEQDTTALDISMPAFWDPDEVPEETEEDFREFTNRNDVFSPNESQISTWTDAPNQDTHASFGDSGVTATVNACGDLMQFSRYLDAGGSGIFCADHTTTNEPYNVQERAKDLLDLSQDKSRQRFTYGMRVSGISMKNCRHLGYVHDRWPRYEVEDKNLKLTIQWLVHEKAVLQQCVITNTGESDVDIPIEFWKGLHIRDMDYLDPTDKFNDDWDGHVPLQGPGGYGWILAHPLKRKGGAEEKKTTKDSPMQLMRLGSRKPTNATSDSHKGDMWGYSGNAKAPHAENDDNQDNIAVVISVFVDGTALRFETPNQKPREKVLKTIRSGAAIEVVSAYKMVRLIKSRASWEDFLISANVADVSKHLRFASKFFTPFSPCSYEPSGVDHGQREGKGHKETGRDWVASTAKGPPKGLLAMEDESVNQPFNHIDFVARRKLEHILSVCAIPLRDPEEEEGDIVPIALTCGDTSGHRVSSPASFFAFSFLLEISKRLVGMGSKSQDDTYGELRQRVYSVCRGHLKWLSSVEKTDSNCFLANYWVNGKKMPRNEESESFMPLDSLTDTPFQIIKVFGFASQYQSEDDLDEARGIIRQVAIPWITALNRSDVRISRAWPHSQDEGCNKYRLSEHVWIWRALKLIEGHFRDFPQDKISDIEDEKFGGDIHRGQSKDERDVATDQHDQVLTDDSLLRKFDSRDVQRDILRRFTAENEISKKRMLAMTRSPRETRFLFHASDTTLFYGINRDFFSEKTSLNEVWQNTIEAQVHHNENSETGWDNSIRYALAIMLGTRDISMNKRPPQELIRSSLEVLFGSTSPNGLFFGLLDSNTKESALFGRENDRDFYFHASFEIPFILLTHCWKIHSKLNTSGTQPESSSAPQVNPSTTHDLLEEVADLNLRQPKRQLAQTDRTARLPMGLVPSPGIAETQLSSTLPQPGAKLKVSKAISMKKSIPFNSLIDQSSIVDLDEEWLYNYPSFFTMEKQTTDDFNKEAEGLLERTERDTSEALISRAAEGYTRYLRNGERRNRPAAVTGTDPLHNLSKAWTDIPSPDGENALEDKSDNMAFVADVLRQRNLQKHERENNITFRGVNSNFKLWYLLSLPRTADKAKKRFIWLPSADDERALVCYLTSPQEERQAISLFFERHYQYEKHFLDETSMVLNTWESELHLNFYKLVDKDYVPVTGIPKGDVDEFPGSEPKVLVKAAVGFRFIGDFFDRHWTCHLVEHIPGGKPAPTRWDRETHERDFPWGDKGHLVQDNHCWRQRKVLELHLFDRILEELVDSTKTIYETVKEELGVKNVAIPFSVLNSEDYFSSSEQWQKFQHILQVLEEDLSDMRVVISKWETREKDRGQERPRWTRTDERKYRRYIGKLEGTTRRRIRDLNRLHVQIQSLKETLRRGQQQIRDDLNLRGSENIRFFTYVTVVFLPLGFASSIFGMSEEPPSSVIPPMIICSVVALLVTIIALANAKRLNGVVEVVSKSINSYSMIKMEGSRLLNSHRRESLKTQNRSREAEEAGSETSDGHLKGNNTQANRGIRAHDDDQSWHFWFWIGYVFVELPARRVLMAYYDLTHPKVTHGSMYFRLVVGILLLPIFLISFFFQIVLINTFDVARRILRDLKSLLESGDSENDKNAKFVKNHLDRLAYPMKQYRPYRTKGGTSQQPPDQKGMHQSSYGDGKSHYSGK